MNNCINCKHFKTPKAKVWKVGKCLKTSTHKLKGDVCGKFEAECLFKVGDEVHYVFDKRGVLVGKVYMIDQNPKNEYPVMAEFSNGSKFTFTPDGRILSHLEPSLLLCKTL